jgi:hypothetical protein
MEKRTIEQHIGVVERFMPGLHPDVQIAIRAIISRAKQTETILATFDRLKTAIAQVFQETQTAAGEQPVKKSRRRSSGTDEETDVEKQMLDVLRERGELKSGELIAAVGLQDNRSAFTYRVRRLCDEGLIKKKGHSRGTSYTLTAKGGKE